MAEVVTTWQTIDLPILRAIVAAEQNDRREITRAARDATPKLPDHQFKRSIRLLAEDGNIEAEIRTNPMGGIAIADVHRAAPKAYKATGAWPNGDTFLSDLLLALKSAEQAEPSTEERSKITAALKAIGSFTGATAANVLAPLVSKRLGL